MVGGVGFRVWRLSSGLGFGIWSLGFKAFGFKTACRG